MPFLLHLVEPIKSSLPFSDLPHFSQQAIAHDPSYMHQQILLKKNECILLHMEHETLRQLHLNVHTYKGAPELVQKNNDCPYTGWLHWCHEVSKFHLGFLTPL